jgi:hypothetical protein
VRSTSELRRLWGPKCAPNDQLVWYITPSGARLQVRKATLEAWQALVTVVIFFGYALRREDTGAYNCRAITGGKDLSLHSFGIAADLNWRCLGGDTVVVTWDGPQRLADIAGTTQRLLTRDPVAGGASRWVDAPVLSLGEDELYEVVVSRRGVVRSIMATPDHHWWKVHGFAQARKHWRTLETTTSGLVGGDRLLGALPPGVGGTLLSSIGVAAGNVYGDGTRTRNRDACVDLYGASVELLRFYPEPRVYSVTTTDGVHGVRVGGLPGYFKDSPPLDESASYLLGWLAGYFAADGHVSRNGHASMTASTRDDLDLFKLVAMRVGIACGDPAVTKREGYGGGTGEKWTMPLLPSTVPERFFVRSDHAARFVATERRPSDHRWRVESVAPAGRGEVFCPTVEGTHTFTLDGWLLTGNTNPYTKKGLITDLPRAMVEAIEAIRTQGGHRVFRWGGDWNDNNITDEQVYDAMHFEIVASPDELTTGIDWHTVAGHGADLPVPIPIPLPPAQKPGRTVSLSLTLPVLQLGDKGENVRRLQKQFVSIGTKLEVTGAFDDATDAAVRQTQTFHGLTVDGIVGEQTWKTLLSLSLPQ